jgi:hypothetical protein
VNIFQVPIAFVDKAWRDGAHQLSEAAEKSGGEITGEQLRLILTRGERILLGMGDETQVTAWAAVQIQQLPNLRACYIYCIWAPGSTSAKAFELLKKYAADNGCSCIRGACNDVISRLWQIKFKARKVYTVLEMDV